jgi:hypothetical protein
MRAVLIDTDIIDVTLLEQGNPPKETRKRAGNAVKRVVAS